jgi:hypothetical protein
MSILSTRQKVGLVLCGLINLANVPSAFFPTPDGETGPPYAILLLASILGAVGLVATVLAWRGNRPALRVAAGALVINVITSLPAFFVDVPAFVKAGAALAVVVTVGALVLMFSTVRPPVPTSTEVAR